MKLSNISLGEGVTVDPTTSINNVRLGDRVKIAKYCSIFGSEEKPLIIGQESYVGMHSMLNGYIDQLTIGKNVSIAQHVLVMVDSGPNASPVMQRLFPIEKGPVIIGDHCWIGAQSIIMPKVELGDYCIVAANSFVTDSFPPYSIIGGNPAKLIRTFSERERVKLHEQN